MLRRFSFSTRVLLFLLVAVAAGAGIGPAFTQQPTTKPATSPAALAGFTVNVTYSQKAMDTLVAGKETVIVVGYLYGFPKQGTPQGDVDHEGKVDLGEAKKEIAPGAIATIGSVKPDQALVKWVDNQGLQILINVYSGRKSSPNNLLDCGIYEGPLAAIQGQSTPISCKLIGEQ
jgi:hypothetical protein